MKIILPIDTQGHKMSEVGLKRDLIRFSPVQKGDKDISLVLCDKCFGTEFQADYCSNCMTTSLVEIEIKEVIDIKVIDSKEGYSVEVTYD